METNSQANLNAQSMPDDLPATQLAADTATTENAQTAFDDLVTAQIAADIATKGNGSLILPNIRHIDPISNIHNLQDYLNYLGIFEVPLIHTNMGVDYAA